ncbi:hypothetical protein ACT6NV_13690 [Robiginitalea sp. IMCC44478]|uniref:hypothetical protein n=1 Tax=Robiginitalea sp. IMCC44478 TaxID=3459122 RepID=UPI004043699E
MGPSIIHSQKPLERFQGAELIKRIKNESRNLKRLLESYACEPQVSAQFELKEKLRKRLKLFRLNCENLDRNNLAGQTDQRQFSRQIRQLSSDYRMLEKEIREYHRSTRH